jgi:hypothetical protein
VLSQPQTATSSGIVTLSLVLLILAWVLISGGLVGLYASQREAFGALGMVGFVVALVGSLLTVVVLCVQTFYIPVAGVTGIGRVVTLIAVVVLLVASIGWFLFGQATYNAGIYPRAAAILLMVGAVINLVIHLSAGEVIVMAAAIAWLGLFLFRGRVSLAEKPARP